MAKNSRQKIIDTAIDLFGQVGVGGASMELVAQSAQLTRQAIYRYFPDRDSLFVEAARHLHETAIDASEAAGAAAVRRGADLADVIAEMLKARFEPFMTRLEKTNFTEEILEENARLLGSVAVQYREKFVEILGRVIKSECTVAKLRTRPGLSPETLAALLFHSAHGIKSSPRGHSFDQLCVDLDQLARIFVGGAIESDA